MFCIPNFLSAITFAFLKIAMFSIFSLSLLGFVFAPLVKDLASHLMQGLCSGTFLSGTFVCRGHVQLSSNLHSALIDPEGNALATLALEVAKARIPTHDLQQIYIDVDRYLADIYLMDIGHKDVVEGRFARVRSMSRAAGLKMARFGMDLESTISRTIFAAESAREGLRGEDAFRKAQILICSTIKLPLLCPPAWLLQVVSDLKRTITITETEYPILMKDAVNLIHDLDDLDEELRELFALLHRIRHELENGKNFISWINPFSRISESSVLTFSTTVDGVESAKHFVDQVRVYLGQKMFTIHHAHFDLDMMGRNGVFSEEFSMRSFTNMDSILRLLNLRIADLSSGRMALREPVKTE